MKDVQGEFLIPFLEKVTTNARINTCEFFNPKAAAIQLFNILSALMFKLKDTIKQKKFEEDEEYEVFLKECQKDIIWSNVLLSTIWSFGGILPRELRRPFEEVFSPFKRKFNINMSSSAAA